MPFKSKAQMRWMFANHPQMAKRWAHETPDMKHLPDHKTEAIRRRARRKKHASS